MRDFIISLKNAGIKKLLTFSLLGLLLAQVTASAENTRQQESANSAASQEAAQLSARAMALYRERKLSEALPLAKRALELLEKELGREHLQIISGLNNLALIYLEQQEYVKAEPCYQRILKIYEKSFGPDDLKATATMINLGWVRYALGANSEAESLMRRALAVNEKTLGPEHLETAVPLYNLARFYQKQGKANQAVPYFQRVLAIKEKRLGPTHKDVAEAVEQCACALEQDKQWAEAKALWERADKIRYGGQPNTQFDPPQVIQGRATRKVPPEYPPAAKSAGISGTALVRVLIDESGQVIEANLLCGPDMLAPAALKAARQWRFQPTVLNGQPTKVVGVLTFNFTLR